MTNIRLATIGTSSISDNLIEALQQVGGIDYLGTMSRDLSRARAFTEAHGGARPFGSIDELASCPEVDAVYVASPNAPHFEQALDLVRAGKHVLVEKPLCANRRQAEALFRAAEERGVVAMEAIRPIHDPAWAAMASYVPTLGQLRRATLRFGKYSSRYDKVLAGEQTNIFDARMASGSLMDIGIYCVEPMVALWGAPSAVASVCLPISDAGSEACGGVIDGAGSALCRYGEGTRQFVVELAHSKICDDKLPSQIEGEAATLSMDAPNTPQHAHVDYRGVPVPAIKATDPTSAGDRREEIAIAPCANSMEFELHDFAALVRAARGEQDVRLTTMWGELDAASALRRFTEVTLESLGVCDEVRRQAGIVFPADAE